MAIADLKHKAEAEYYERHRAQSRRASPVRLDEEVWARLDRLAIEVGWSRNKLIAELMDTASEEFAAELARDDETRELDEDRFWYLVGDRP